MVKPGMRVANTFCELDEVGQVIGFKRVEGTFLKYELGYAKVQYKNADLPRRCQSAVLEDEFRVLSHEDEPDEILV